MQLRDFLVCTLEVCLGQGQFRKVFKKGNRLIHLYKAHMSE